MHRFGQRLRREILKPETEDHAHGTTGTETPPEHEKELRRRLEEFDGERIRKHVKEVGMEGVLEAIGASARELEELERTQPGKGVEERKRMRERALAIYREEMGGEVKEEEEMLGGGDDGQ